MTTPALSPTISDAPAPQPAADWNALRAAGLAYVEQFGHQLWTDYNRHDPGITTLELLCYAITDLSQRTAADVKDVLRTSFGPADFQKDETYLDNSLLLPAHEAFPTSPVTLLDYRKLLLDVPGVRNAWLVRNTFEWQVFLNSLDDAGSVITTNRLVYKANGDLSGAASNYTYSQLRGGPSTPLYTIQGLYDLLVDLDPRVATSEAAKTEILQQVRAAYLGNRNLGEDLVEVEALPTLNIGVQATIELGPDADPAAVYAQLLLAIDQHLAPVVKRYSLAEMQALTDADGQPLGLDQLYEGPRLTRGFIRDADLTKSELRTSIHASDIIALALEIPGVLAISGLKMSGATTSPADAMDTTLPYSSGDGHWTLNVRQPCRLELQLDSPTALQFTRNGREVSNLTTKTAALRQFQQLQQELLAATVRSVPELPVPLGTALDLQSYAPLALDYPATYGIGPAGLPADAPLERRHQARQMQAYLLFFDQLLANYLAQLMNVRHLLTTAPTTGNTYFGQLLDQALLPELQELFHPTLTQNELSVALATGAPSATDTDRHNRFLDHLLARFGESFAEYGLLVYNAQTLPPASPLEHKKGLAQDVPQYHPARGFNYTLPSWRGEDAALQVTEPDRDANGGLIILTPRQPQAVKDDATARANVSAIARRFGRLVGMPEANFEGHASLLPTSLLSIPSYTPQEWRAKVAGLTSNETIIVVEHTLLRPLANNTTEWLEQGLAGRTPGDLIDPYSYRITILLPAEAPRFADPVFRQHAEVLLRAELPAHVLAHICWVSAAHLAEFEATYSGWLYYKRRLRPSSDAEVQNLQRWQAAVVRLLNLFHSAYLPKEFPGPAGRSIAFWQKDPLKIPLQKGFDSTSFL
jgi:hypothetical protein